MTKRQGVYLALLSFAVLSFLFGPAWGTGCSLAIATVIGGDRSTVGTQADIQNTRVVDMSDIIHMLDPNAAPLTAIMGKLRKTHCINPKVEWMEDEFLPTSVILAAPLLATSTTVVLSTTQQTYFRAGDVVKVVDSGETMYVSSLSSTTALMISRAIGTVTAADQTTGATFLIIGNANAEFARGRTVKATQKVAQYNYCQIFRTPFGASETLQNSELYGGNDLTYQSRKNAIEHRKHMEAAFLFGERHTSESDLSAATGMRFCGGIIERVSDNTITSSTSVTLANLETFLRLATRYGSSTKVLFASRHLLSYINQVAVAKIQSVPATKSFPLTLSEYVSPHGKMYLIPHNQLEGAVGAALRYQGYGLALDMESIWMRYLQNRDTKLKQNIQENDEDGRRDEYITEACPMVIHARFHAIWTSATASA